MHEQKAANNQIEFERCFSSKQYFPSANPDLIAQYYNQHQKRIRRKVKGMNRINKNFD